MGLILLWMCPSGADGKFLIHSQTPLSNLLALYSPPALICLFLRAAKSHLLVLQEGKVINPDLASYVLV